MMRVHSLILAAGVAIAPLTLSPVAGSISALEPIAEALLPSAQAFDSRGSRPDNARTVRGRNRLVTNPQIRRDLFFQRSPGIRARPFSEIGLPEQRAPRPSGSRFTEGRTTGTFDPRVSERQLGQNHPSLPGNEPTEAEIAFNRDLLDGIEFPQPELRGWLTKTSRQQRVERPVF